VSVFDLLLNAGTFCITYSVLYCCRNLIFYVISGSSFLSLASLLYVDYVLLVAIILPQTLFTNPVFPTLPRKIPSIFPVKVTYKTSTKKNAKAKTKKLTYTMKVAKASVALSGESAVAVGSTTKLTTTKKASSRAKITYTSSDETVATVAADGTVTGVKAGKATITAKLVIGKDTATATQDVEVKNYVLKSVRQTKAGEFEAVVDGKTSNILKSDITVANADTKVVYPVQKVSVDKKDATKVTFNTFSGLTDGKTYNVTLDGTTLSMNVTDGKVASVNVNKLTIPYATETEIKLVATDANGVVLDDAAYGSQDASKYDFTLTTTDGYIAGSKLYLNKVGSVATGEITYKSGKYTADGKPDGNVGPVKFTITAVDQAAVNNYAVRIGTASDRTYDSAKDNNKVAVEDIDKAYAYFKITDADGNEVSHYNDYTVESSDTNILLIASGNGTKLDQNNYGKYKNFVALEGVKPGTAYLIIKKNNVIVGSFAVSVVEKRKVASIAVDNNSLTLSNAVVNNKVVTASFKDQYGDDFTYTEGGLKVTCLSVPSGLKTSDVQGNSDYYTASGLQGNKQKVTFMGRSVLNSPNKEGTYSYKIAYTDKNGAEVVAQTVTVSIKTPGEDGKSALSFDLDMSSPKVDTTVTKDNAVGYTGQSIAIKVAEQHNGTTSQYLKVNDRLGDNTDVDKKSTVKHIYYTVKKGNDVVYADADSTVVGSTAVTNAAINVSNDILTVGASTVSGSAISKLDAGTYQVTAVVYTLPAGKADNVKNFVKKTIQKSFTIEDKQDIVKVSFTGNTVDAGTTIEDALANLVDYSYDGVTYNKDNTPVQVVSIEGTTNAYNSISRVKIDGSNYDTFKIKALAANTTLNVTKITVSFTYEGYTLTQTVAVNGNPSITAK